MSSNSDGLLKRFFNQLLALPFKIADSPEIGLLILSSIQREYAGLPGVNLNRYFFSTLLMSILFYSR